ncbi:DUF3667 domain-containing protein [Tenacibaculum sp. S7007]|uniref:DUF3667 domain-containing protein n=1 Tax=Tenacibaculum pelagium TaxID=2759527 RepID=A0A839APX3_9FLAO|nr:DUF3667 domain-containing protein [Tenacibaculum pelagium]MBA6156430.1 DUF3667 domain-containing protein [Tenacibaculum pelagium]
MKIVHLPTFIYEKTMEEEIENLSIAELKTELFAFLNLEKGIPFTYITLFKKPFQAIKTYTSKDRKYLTNPLKYLLFSVAVYTLFVNYHKGFKDFMTNANKGNKKMFEGLEKMFDAELFEKFLLAQEFYMSSMNIIYLFAVPVVGLVTYLFFRKKYNYAENLAIHCYLFGTANWTSLLLVLITLLFNFSGGFMLFLMIITFMLIVYLMKHIYQIKWITAIGVQILLAFIFMIVTQVYLLAIFFYYLLFT